MDDVPSFYSRELCGKDFGECTEGRMSCQVCDEPYEGNITAKCQKNKWIPVLESCVSRNMLSLLQIFTKKPEAAIPLENSEFPMLSAPIPICFMFSDYARTVREEQTTAGNIATIVMFLDALSQKCFTENSQSFSEEAAMESITDAQEYSIMANHILNSSTIPNWSLVPKQNASLVLLGSLHTLASSLVGKIPFSSPVDIQNDFLHLQANKVTEDSDFKFQFNDARQPVNGEILIRKEEFRDVFDMAAVSIGFLTLGQILPTESENISVNGLVMSVVLSSHHSEILLKFEKVNKSSNINSYCTAWDGGQEKWTQDPCQLQEESKNYSICKCNYSPKYLSFSILMSPKTKNNQALYYISVIGLAISIFSLILCLLIESLLWKNITKQKTAYIRHVSIVNIAVSLLIADVWFIVGTTIHKSKISNLCIATTFFIHFFYLSLFFWMLVLGLFILYRTILVFHDMQRTVMQCISFTLGYGCPLIICLLTIAITLSNPKKPYTRQDSCWLNWSESKALLAFVIPVLVIVAANAVIILTVIVILLRRSLGEMARISEISSLVQIGRCVGILTPLLGLTWGIGIATVIEDSSEVFDYLFTILNAFQGLLILLLGTLMDAKTGNIPTGGSLSSTEGHHAGDMLAVATGGID
ncbi:adhesion G protein-coupled receptor F4 [Rhinophrynus dorsalis]